MVGSQLRIELPEVLGSSLAHRLGFPAAARNPDYVRGVAKDSWR